MCEVRVELERFLAVGGVTWPWFQFQVARICIDVPIRAAMEFTSGATGKSSVTKAKGHTVDSNSDALL